MLRYNQLKDKTKELLAATGLKRDEFEELLEEFKKKYTTNYPADRTKEGKPRQRRAGAGTKGKLDADEDKLLFILLYEKTYPLQTMLGLEFEMSQGQANYWIHHLLPILQETLAEMGMTPERDATKVAKNELAQEERAEMLIDGSERRRQRPKNAEKQKEHYSGKKKAHTDKNILLVNSQTRKVVYLSPTEGGQKHDKRMVDETPITYPSGATLGKDTGFQGYEPKGVHTFQPKKSPKVRN